MNIDILYKASLTNNLKFVVDGVTYYYNDDACCQSIVKVKGKKKIVIWDYCIYNKENQAGIYPEFMDKVWEKVKEEQ